MVSDAYIYLVMVTYVKTVFSFSIKDDKVGTEFVDP